MRGVPMVTYHVVVHSPARRRSERLELRGSEDDARRLADQLQGVYLGPIEKPCPACLAGDLPSHNGSRYCESGSIASGGTEAHCTCDVCF